MNLEECFANRLLRKGRPDRLKCDKAFEIAHKNLLKAERLLKHGFHEEAVVAAYTAMFQSARALLFKEGIFERSHYCVIEYLREYYVKKHLLSQDYLHSIDVYRTQRHEALYGLEEISYEKDEVKDAIEKTKKFIRVISQIAKKS
jgi:uncharacterized protein (UPF0332 family)